MTPPGLRVECARRVEEVAPWAAAWDALAARGPAQRLASSHAFALSHLEHRSDGRPWLVLLARQGERLVGVLPLRRDPHPLLGARGPRLRTPPGDATQEEDALLDAAAPRAVLRALLDGARRAEPGHVAVEIGAVTEASATLAAVRRPLPEAFVARDLDTHGRRLPVRGTYEAWRGTLGTNLPRNLRKAASRAAAGGGTRFEILRGGSADPGLLAEFADLEASGWKAEGGRAVAQDPSSLAFHRALASRAAARGWLEWHRLRIGGRTAAMHMAFRLGRVLALHKIAYDESQGRLMPGNLLFDHVVRDAFEGGATDFVDCFTDMGWHDLWRLERYPYLRVRCFPRRPLPTLAGYLPERLRPHARRWRLLARWRAARAGAPPSRRAEVRHAPREAPPG